MDNNRLIKFEVLVEDINTALGARNYGEEYYNATLCFIYVYDKLNDFGKIVYNCSQLCFQIKSGYDYFSTWIEGYAGCNHWITNSREETNRIAEAFKDGKKRNEAIKVMLKVLREGKWEEDLTLKRVTGRCWRGDAYRFIFWAMMVLVVDDTDKEEHLSAICDFARMLRLTDDEVLDIANVIKIVTQDETAEELKNDSVKTIFEKVINLYNNY